jgi:hypothetical protein
MIEIIDLIIECPFCDSNNISDIDYRLPNFSIIYQYFKRCYNCKNEIINHRIQYLDKLYIYSRTDKSLMSLITIFPDIDWLKEWIPKFIDKPSQELTLLIKLKL